MTAVCSPLLLARIRVALTEHSLAILEEERHQSHRLRIGMLRTCEGVHLHSESLL